MAAEPAAVEREREYTEKVEKKRAEAEEAEKKRAESATAEMMASASTAAVKRAAANRAVASKVENEPGTSGRARAKRGAPKWVKEMRERQATRNAKAAGTTGGGLKRNFTRKPRRHRESRPLR
jgi:hypothetical protein